jgi:hypothetical protein
MRVYGGLGLVAFGLGVFGMAQISFAVCKIAETMYRGFRSGVYEYYLFTLKSLLKF